MFESIRKHTKVAMFAMFLLIIPSFVLVGIDRSYFSGASPVVARVDGQDITQADWDNAHRMESDRLRAQQPGIDGALLDSPQARYSTLERMVRDRVLQAAATKLHMNPSNARLTSALQEIPEIAALRRPDGTLDAEGYRKLVGAQGLTPESFEARMRNNLAVNQVLNTVMSTGFATPAQADVNLSPLFEQREIRVARFEPKDFVSKVAPTEADLETYYKEHTSQFQQPERADVQYVVLDLDTVRAGITLNEDDLKTYFKENQEQFAGKEERRASHILIAVPKDAPAAQRSAAKARAEELRTQVLKAPDSFADVAKKNSQDPGSAGQGGDLGFFNRGAMVKPFEDAAFGLEKNAISPVVESDFGYHIIKLTDIKTPKAPTFEEKRAEIESQLKQRQAQQKFAEIAETFTNMVYEQSDSLQPVADKLKLKIQTATNITRAASAADTGVLANPKLRAALFSADALENKRNTEAIETGPSQLVSARITNHTPARTLSLAEAHDKVRSLYVADKAAAMARAEGEDRRAAWAKDPASAGKALGAPVAVSRQDAHQQPPMVVDQVLSQDPTKLPAWVGVDLGAQGYAVAQITRILDKPKEPEAVVAQRRQQYAQMLAQAEALGYYDWLKQKFKVQFKVPKPSQTLSVDTGSVG